MKTLYVYKTKLGFGGLLKAGIRCKVITHVFGCDKCFIKLYRKNQFYTGSLNDLERFMD
jgi:hypothetical protein